jgi:hypothetical protein
MLKLIESQSNLLKHRICLLISFVIALHPSLSPILCNSFRSVIAKIVKSNDHHVLHWRPHIRPIPLFTAMESCRWNATRIIIEFLFLDVLNNSISDVFALCWIVAAHPKWRKICWHKIISRFVVDHVVIEPCAGFFVPKNFVYCLKNSIFNKFYNEIIKIFTLEKKLKRYRLANPGDFSVNFK